MTNPKFQKLPKMHKSYKELLLEEAKKNPKVYGSYIRKGKVEVEPKGFHFFDPISDKNYFNNPL